MIEVSTYRHECAGCFKKVEPVCSAVLEYDTDLGPVKVKKYMCVDCMADLLGACAKLIKLKEDVSDDGRS